MKNLIQLLAAVFLAAMTGFASPEEEAKLYKALTSGGEDSVIALETILSKSEEVSAVTLFMASGAALNNEDFTNSAYLFYIAKFRAQFDKEVFPPIGTGGDSPMVLFGALSSQYGSAINPEIMRRPKEFKKSLHLTNKWNPRVAKDFNPGWEFSERKSVKTATKKLKEGKYSGSK